MALIGRKSEIETFEELEKTQSPQLVCVYGRRRVGKTYLVEQLFEQDLAFHAVGQNKASTRKQLSAFSRQLRQYGAKLSPPIGDWHDAFDALASLLKSSQVHRAPSGKKIVFLDEFPWFDSKRSDFLEAFSYFWNLHCANQDDLMFIICGSATSWIVEKVLNDTQGLYNRVTRRIFIEPFTLSETKRFLEERQCDWSDEQIIECQMIFGGLPYFLDMLSPRLSLAQNIDRLCLSPHADLRNEAFTLLESTMRQSKHYARILEVLSQHKYGVKQSELMRRLNISKGQISTLIGELSLCGYVNTYKSQAEPQKPLYVQLVDPFLLFHYRFLAAGGDDGFETWNDYRNDSGRYTNWRGNAFEILCFYHKSQIKKILGIASVKTKCYPWSSQRKSGGAQIDMVIERKDQTADLCEMKFTDQPFELDQEYAHELARKRAVFKEESGWKGATRIILVSVNGVSETSRKYSHNVAQIVTAADLVG